MIAIRMACVVIVFAALIILRELSLSKDGLLRKILIAYFVVEIVVWSTLFYTGIKYVFPDYVIKIVLLALIPKFAVKMWFLWFVLPKESGRKLY